jgi:hypothetical protein
MKNMRGMRGLAMEAAVLLFPLMANAVCTWNANVGTAASPYAAADIQACVDDASSKTGDVVVRIPNSNATWTNKLTINMRSGFAGVASLTLRGQNDCTLDADGRPTACGTNISNAGIDFSGMEGKGFRLAHMRIAGTSPGDVVDISGDCKSWRIDHVFFDTVSASRLIFVTRSAQGHVTYGVADHCRVLNSSIFIHYQPSFDGGNWDWMNPLGLGSADALYLENNTFLCNTGTTQMMCVTDCNGSGKFVVRHNDFFNCYLSAHDAIVVGLRGVRKWEIYENRFNYNDHGNCFVGFIRSGTGVMYNNTINDPDVVLCGSGISFIIYRNTSPGGDPWDAKCGTNTGKACLNTSSTYPKQCNADADCGGESGSCVAVDGNGAPDGYPCRDQLGADGNNPQVSRPMLFWNNTKNGGPITLASEAYMAAGRDYCLSDTAMPATCNGVPTVYSPYSYPHPLIVSGPLADSPSAPITTPAQPRGLRVR